MSSTITFAAVLFLASAAFALCGDKPDPFMDAAVLPSASLGENWSRQRAQSDDPQLAGDEAQAVCSFSAHYAVDHTDLLGRTFSQTVYVTDRSPPLCVNEVVADAKAVPNVFAEAQDLSGGCRIGYVRYAPDKNGLRHAALYVGLNRSLTHLEFSPPLSNDEIWIGDVAILACEQLIAAEGTRLG